MYSIVVPVYRNEATLAELLRQLDEVSRRLASPLEAIFVIDGSPDNSYALLKMRLPEMSFRSQLICLSRNFGSFAAIRAGLAAAAGEHVAFLAADLQQPVTSLQLFLSALERGADVVIGRRSTRADPSIARAGSTMFWWLYRRFVQPEMPIGGVDAFACTRQVRDVIGSLPDVHNTLVGLLLWVGFRRELVEYPRAERPVGRSGWTFARKIRYAVDTTFAFSDLPITAIILAGIGGILISIVIALAVVVAWASGAATVRGYTPLMLAVLLSFSTTLLAVGLVGGYVWRIFENTKGRPAHIVRSIERIVPPVPKSQAGERA